MPHVMNDTEMLEQLARSLDTDTAQSQTPVLPASRRGHAGLMASLWGRVLSLLTAAFRPRWHTASPCSQHSEMPLDILAREHPYLHMRALIG